jgi:hypothetical protein
MTDDPADPRSPFHDGEKALQARVGVADKIEAIGRKVIRDFMPDEHRQLFGLLPLLLIGSVDRDGHPVASVVTGAPGFLSAQDNQLLNVAALPVTGDPLARNLRPGAPVGLLGIEFHSRRRNRMNGIVGEVGAQGFSVQVGQSFGNCPKYIQAREWLPGAPPAAPPVPETADRLDREMVSLVSGADTFFIASACRPQDPKHPSHGVDVSHRGGPPGFVTVETDRALSFPDYIGNFLFNTLGNLEADPRAALLFLNFDTGETLQLHGSAQVRWDDPRTKTVPGAQRLVSFRVQRAVRSRAVLPGRWRYIDQSPHIARFKG